MEGLEEISQSFTKTELDPESGSTLTPNPVFTAAQVSYLLEDIPLSLITFLLRDLMFCKIYSTKTNESIK